jgi:hypothetical protein
LFWNAVHEKKKPLARPGTPVIVCVLVYVGRVRLAAGEGSATIVEMTVVTMHVVIFVGTTVAPNFPWLLLAASPPGRKRCVY